MTAEITSKVAMLFKEIFFDETEAHSIAQHTGFFSLFIHLVTKC